MIWAFHDVSPNTKVPKLLRMIGTIEDCFPGTEILCAITLFAGRSNTGSLYPEMPIGNKPWADLLRVSSPIYDGIGKFFDARRVVPQAKVVSHGLVHVQHASLHIDAQRMSIAMSCNYLGTDTFIPPFDSYNGETLKVCAEHGIGLEPVRKNDWHCLERHTFDPTHERWHCHPWKWTAATFEEAIHVA